jgi:hypothetical protein
MNFLLFFINFANVKKNINNNNLYPYWVKKKFLTDCKMNDKYFFNECCFAEELKYNYNYNYVE